MSSGVVVRLPTSPKIDPSGVRTTYPAVGRVARGFRVIPRGLDVPMSGRIPHLSLKADRSPADSDCVRRLLEDYRADRISRAECLDGIEAVKRFGSLQPGLF